MQGVKRRSQPCEYILRQAGFDCLQSWSNARNLEQFGAEKLPTSLPSLSTSATPDTVRSMSTAACGSEQGGNALKRSCNESVEKVP